MQTTLPQILEKLKPNHPIIYTIDEINTLLSFIKTANQAVQNLKKVEESLKQILHNSQEAQTTITPIKPIKPCGHQCHKLRHNGESCSVCKIKEGFDESVESIKNTYPSEIKIATDIIKLAAPTAEELYESLRKPMGDEF